MVYDCRSIMYLWKLQCTTIKWYQKAENLLHSCLIHADLKQVFLPHYQWILRLLLISKEVSQEFRKEAASIDIPCIPFHPLV